MCDVFQVYPVRWLVLPHWRAWLWSDSHLGCSSWGLPTWIAVSTHVFIVLVNIVHEKKLLSKSSWGAFLPVHFTLFFPVYYSPVFTSRPVSCLFFTSLFRSLFPGLPFTGVHQLPRIAPFLPVHFTVFLPVNHSPLFTSRLVSCLFF